MAARVVGIRQEGESLPDGAVHEGRGTRASCELPRWYCVIKKKGEQKQASLSGEQDSLGRGERPPVWGTG